MRQILQSLADGRTILAEIPDSTAPRGGLLIRTSRTLISAGTERMLVDFSRAGWFDKARQQPEKVLQLFSKIRTDGLLPTIDAVRSRLDQPLPLGYCNVGTVIEAGGEVTGFKPGDRVVSNGPHAEQVSVPRNLCARIPDGVSDDEAAFVVLGAIALQGVRLAMPTLGERFVVTGLGLIGLLTVQLLRASGCRVLGIDPDPRKSQLARSFGAETVALERGEDPLAVAESFTSGQGIDGVLITASTTSNEPMSQAAKMCRKRGRIVLIGVTGLELQRGDFYQKELTFQVSCSYGPGRYDPEYEERGKDYPLGFVRWTEQRNFEAVLAMLMSRALNVQPLISHRFAFDDAPSAYELLATGKEPYLGILIEYRDNLPREQRRTMPLTVPPQGAATSATGAGRVSFIGAGNYAGRVLIPAFAAAGAHLSTIASAGGSTAAYYGRKYGFRNATTDSAALFADADNDTIVIATRHDTHARFVAQSLAAGKHVFVEKPLAISQAQLDQVEQAWNALPAQSPKPVLMVGFNRRFAPHVQRMKQLLTGVSEPCSFVVTVNAGAIPRDHWTQDPATGGGRIIGEGCHFIDLLRFLAGAPIAEARVVVQQGPDGKPRDDVASITLRFANHSWGAIHYVANGHKDVPKERIEVFCAGRVLQLDNFRKMRGFGWPGFVRMNLWRQDKGQAACARAFLAAVRGGASPPIPYGEIIEVARVAVELGEAARR